MAVHGLPEGVGRSYVVLLKGSGFRTTCLMSDTCRTGIAGPAAVDD
jgi:hypothetical protein